MAQRYGWALALSTAPGGRQALPAVKEFMISPDFRVAKARRLGECPPRLNWPIPNLQGFSMTTSFPVTKTGSRLRLELGLAAGFLAMALLASPLLSSPAR